MDDCGELLPKVLKPTLAADVATGKTAGMGQSHLSARMASQGWAK